MLEALSAVAVAGDDDRAEDVMVGGHVHYSISSVEYLRGGELCTKNSKGTGSAIHTCPTFVVEVRSGVGHTSACGEMCSVKVHLDIG